MANFSRWTRITCAPRTYDWFHAPQLTGRLVKRTDFYQLTDILFLTIFFPGHAITQTVIWTTTIFNNDPKQRRKTPLGSRGKSSGPFFRLSCALSDRCRHPIFQRGDDDDLSIVYCYADQEQEPSEDDWCPVRMSIWRNGPTRKPDRASSLALFSFCLWFCLMFFFLRFCSSHWRRAASRFLSYNKNDVDVFYVFFDWLCFGIIRMRFHSSAPLKILYCVTNS